MGNLHAQRLHPLLNLRLHPRKYILDLSHGPTINVNITNFSLLKWWCAQNTTGDNALIRLNGDSYTISARVWAFAGYFRFARPGSVRVDASSSAEDVYVSTFVNTNGTVAVPVVNAAHFAQSVRVDLRGLGSLTKGSAYLTDNAHNVSLVGRFAVKGNAFQATVEPRSMKTFFLEE